MHINNKNVSYVSKNSVKNVDVSSEINKLFKSSRYVFNIGVIITTKDKTYDTKIISRNRWNLLTIDDDIIPIKDITDIIIKDRY